MKKIVGEVPEENKGEEEPAASNWKTKAKKGMFDIAAKGEIKMAKTKEDISNYKFGDGIKSVKKSANLAYVKNRMTQANV